VPSPRDWVMTIAELDLLAHLQAHSPSEVDSVFSSQAAARAHLAQQRTQMAEALLEAELASVGDGDYLARETHKKALNDAATKAFDEIGRRMFRFNSGVTDEIQKEVLDSLAPHRKVIHFGLVDLTKPHPRWHRSVLAVAIEFGADKVVAWLLQNGADPNAKTTTEDGKGVRPLHIALRKLQEVGYDTATPYYSIIWMLLERGADIEGLDDESRSPLELANAITKPASFPLALVYNVLRLAHERLPASDNLSARQPYRGPDTKDTVPSFFVPPLATTFAAKVKAVLDKEAAEREEQERLRKQKEAEEEKLQSQAQTRKVVEALKRAKGVREQLDSLFVDLANTWLDALKVLCDEENFVLFEPRAARPGAEKKQPCSLDSKLKLPQQTYLRSAIAFGNPFLVEALVVAYASVSTPLAEPADGVELAPEIDLKTDLGESPLHLAAKKLSMQNGDSQAIVSTLLSYGADINAKDAAGRTPLDVCTSEAAKQWLQAQDSATDKYERTSNMRQVRLPIIYSMAEETHRELLAKKKLEEEIAERKRQAEEEIKRREEELERQRLEREREEKLRQEQLEEELRRKREEEEQARKKEIEERLKLEQARLEAAAASIVSETQEADLPHVKPPTVKTTLADKFDQKEQDDLQAQREALARLDQTERLSREEQKRRDAIAAEEKAEEGQIATLAERKFLEQSAGTLVFTDQTPALPWIQQLEPRVSEYTRHCMQKMYQDFRFFRNKLNGFAITFKEFIEDIEQDYIPIWERCKFLTQEISSHEGYSIKNINMLQTAVTPSVIREIKRRQEITLVKIKVMDDLLRPLLESLDPASPEYGSELRLQRRYMVQRQEARAAEEGAFYEPIVNPVIKPEIASVLAKSAEEQNTELATLIEGLTPEQKEMTVLIANLPEVLSRPDLTEWGAVALVTDRLNATESEIQDLKEQAAKDSQAQAQPKPEEGAETTTTTTSPDAAAPTLSPEQANQMKALEVQKAQCEFILAQLKDIQQDRFKELSPWAQRWFTKKAEAEEQRAKAAKEALENAKRQREIAKLGKFESLISSVIREHKDWDRRHRQHQVTIAAVDEDEKPDLGPDLEWIRDNIDFTGIDEDIKKFCRQNPKPMVRLYLATKGAETEADEAFVRKVLQKSSDSLTPTQRNDLVDYQAFLQRRIPQFRRLFQPYTKDLAPHRVQDLIQLRDATRDLVLERRFHDAKAQVTDWNDFKTQIAVETYLDIVCADFSDLHVGPRDEIPLRVLIELHRSLHCECRVSEDLVEMIVSEVTKSGKVTKSNFLQCLESLQVACRRDEQIRWDAQTFWPAHPLTHGSFNPDEAEMIFSFNDHDVVRKFFNDFLQSHHDEIFKSTLAKSKAFAPDVYSRVCRNLGKASSEFIEYLVQNGRTEEALTLSGKEVAALAESEAGSRTKPDPEDNMDINIPRIPALDDSYYRRDPYIGIEDVDPKRFVALFSDVDEYNEVSSRPEYNARLPVGLNDLRRALVQVPKLEFYAPRGWKQDVVDK